MMNPTFKYSIIYITALLCLSSCTKFVQIDPPTDKLVTANVYTSDGNAIAALTQIYSRMVNDASLPYSLSAYTGFSADELKSWSSSKVIVPFYLNAHRTIDTDNSVLIWTTLYKLLYQANAVYEGCNNSPKISAPVRKQLMAEALFIRAWLHFYLVNLYGDIPLITTTDYVANGHIARTPAADVYKQIIADLEQAAKDLSPKYVSANSVDESAERVRPNSYTATAFLARVYLYTGQYAAAEAAATTVINNTALYHLEPLDNVFLTNSREAIWQLMTPLSGGSNTMNTQEGFNYILVTKPNTSTQTANIATISDQLLNAFEVNDQRKNKWIGVYTDEATHIDYYFPYKYKVRSSATLSEYTTPFRLAEQYLIRAEARAQLDNPDAAADLDQVRNRAGLGNTTAANKTDLLNAIWQERRVELFTEYGHRWLDLKRTHTIDAVMTVVTPQKGGGAWQSYQQLWPIPQTEIDRDHNLEPNNPGYEQ